MVDIVFNKPITRREPIGIAVLWRDFSRNRGAVAGLFIVCLLIICAVFANWLAPYSPFEQYNEATLQAPTFNAPDGHAYLLGTDPVGRDIFSRLIHGTRLSLAIGLITVTLSTLIGILLGLWSAYAGGWVDFCISRLMDILLALPSLLLAVAVVAIISPGLVNAMYAIAIVMLPHSTRLMRSLVSTELAKDYIAAARAIGASTPRILFREVLPNCAAPMIVQATLGVSTAILDAAALGFLSLGAQPPAPEWGSMLASALEFIQRAWWVVTFPGLAILVTVLALNLMGDGLRDALDPRLKR